MSENQNNILLKVPAKVLKFTSLNSAPREVQNGRCEVSTANHKLFACSIYCNEKSVKTFRFLPDQILSIHKRDKSFTIIFKKENSKFQFIGEFENIDNVSSFCKFFEEIKCLKNSSSKPFKENLLKLPRQASPIANQNGNHTFLTSENNSFVNSKRNSLTPRRVLAERKTSSIFPSPNLDSSPQEDKHSINGQLDKGDNDVKITAYGMKKTRNFYSGNVKSRIKKRFNYIKPKNSSGLFNTFQDRKESWKTEQNQNAVVGFSNLGNTCYMNSILQCLLNIPNFFQDINNELFLEIVEHNSLYYSLCNLGILKYSNELLENQRFALKRVKTAISAAATRFSGYAQHDAHEFLCQCLHQLNDDLFTQLKKQVQVGDNLSDDKEVMNRLKEDYMCPVRENFESIIHHSIICKQCNEIVEKKEECNDFSLVIPEKDENSYGYDFSITDLLDFYFQSESIEYTCTKCDFTSAELTHQFEVLPRILIFQIKRYDTLSAKLTDRIQLPQVIDMSSHVVSENLKKPKSFIYDKSKFQVKSLNSVINESKRKLTFTSDPTEPFEKSLKIHEDNSEKLNGERQFTKIKSSLLPTPKLTDRKKFDTNLDQFDDDNDDFDFQKDVDTTDLTKFTTVSEDEEEEFQKALELSMLDFEEKNKTALNECQVNGYSNNNTPMQNTRPKFSVKNIKKSDLQLNGSKESPIISGESQSKYHLVGIVNHHGENTATGHYTSDCYNFKNKKWYSFNDLTVKEVSEHEVMYGRCETAYLCFYMYSGCFDNISEKCCQIDV